MVADGFRYLEQDGRRLGTLTTLLLSLIIVICFRSIRWVFIPVAVVQLSLLLTRAILVSSGMRLSMVSSMLTAIVTVVGVATVVHVIVRFREGRTAGLEARPALQRAATLLAVPIFWTCATDAVGFASLIIAQVGPVQDFGLMMAVGSLMVLVSVGLLVPGLALVGPARSIGKPNWGEERLGIGLEQLIHWMQRRPTGVSATVALTMLVSVAGLLQLQVETDFTKNFRSTSPIVQSYGLVERNLGGAGVLDLVLPAPAKLDWAYLHRVDSLERRLRTEVFVLDEDGQSRPGLTKILSLADAVIASSPIHPDDVTVEFIRKPMVTAALTSMRSRMPVFAAALFGEDPEEAGRCYFRVMLRAHERQPADQKQSLIEQITRISREEFPPNDDPPGAEVTGFFVLLTNLIDSIIRDQWLTFAVASTAIGLMMVVAFRSPLYAVIALIPNALPILLVLGLMGWLGVRVNMGAAMIAAVSMGLSVDSSIHYITFFRRARLAGKSVVVAIDEVQRTVGRAVVFSTLALIVGFLVLCTSQFVPTIYFGVLVCLSMLGGLFGNLVLLPLLLGWFGQKVS